jgi:hypothetical protein
VCATIRNVDTANSLIFTYGLQPAVDGFPKTEPSTVNQATSQLDPVTKHSFEGLWWKHEPNVSGFLALANLSANAMAITVNVTDQGDVLLGSHELTVASHATKMVDLAELKSSNSDTGGIYVVHDGREHSLAINGALYDNAVGYSARLSLIAVPDSSLSGPEVKSFTYSELGLMNGVADPMLSFPANTVFTPYSVVRNVSNQPASVSPTLWWMEGAQPRSALLPQITVPAHRTVNLNVPGLMTSGGLKHFNGSFNLILDMNAQAGAITMNGGSVDAKNTYVFEVVPHSVMESAAKSISYWSTANGDDTMFTLWNPADEDQDFVFTLFFSGGSYAYPIHLVARSTRTFNVSEISRSAIPDEYGKIIPAAIHEGSAEIAGPGGENQHILISEDAGIYNVKKAVCGPTCETCSGQTGTTVVDNPFALAVAATKQQTFYMQWNSGLQYNMTTYSSWTSSANGVATVNVGLVSGVGSGTATISAYDASDEPPYIANYCYTSGNGACPVGGPLFGSGPGNICNFTISPKAVSGVYCDGRQNSTTYVGNVTPSLSQCNFQPPQSSCSAKVVNGGSLDYVSNMDNLSSVQAGCSVQYFAGPGTSNENIGTLEFTMTLQFGQSQIKQVQDASVFCK